MARRVVKDLRGDSVLYPYLQKELLTDDVWLFQMLTSRLISSLGVWISPDSFRSGPILLPYVVRDESARGRSGGKERWASPDPGGFLRDDNSLIKEAVKSLTFTSPRPYYDGRRIGRASGWVAAHVWQLRLDETRASRHHTTNSFVPNLVWLPRQLSQLSDRAGSFVQTYLKALSYKIYRGCRFESDLGEIVQSVWDQLPRPDFPEHGLPSVNQLNFFAHDPVWVRRHRAKLMAVLQLVDARSRQKGFESRLRPTRYREGLRTMSPRSLNGLLDWLKRYSSALPGLEPDA